jgi:sulfur carrier protein ThiS
MTPSIRARRAYSLIHQGMMSNAELSDDAIVATVDRDFVPKNAAERDEVIDDVIALRDAINELSF